MTRSPSSGVLTGVLLLLADGRTPSGAHIHSGGVETAISDGRITDVATLRIFLRGRLSTVGVVAAGVAAASCAIGRGTDVGVAQRSWDDLDRAVDARTPSAAQRDVSRSLGKSLQRLARHGFTEIRPGAPVLEQIEPHQAVALGALCARAGGTPRDAAQLAAYQSVCGPASAAVRLLGLDPYAVTSLLAELAGDIDATASVATAVQADGFDELPACSAPVLDEDAERHRSAEVRLFAS
jgi:urease accessory protein